MTAIAVAEWMIGEIRRQGILAQDVAAYGIRENFGEDFTYINENGNLAIAKPVLAAFKRLSGDDVIWSRGERLWRLRQDFDGPGRRQD